MLRLNKEQTTALVMNAIKKEYLLSLACKKLNSTEWIVGGREVSKQDFISTFRELAPSHLYGKGKGISETEFYNRA